MESHDAEFAPIIPTSGLPDHEHHCVFGDDRHHWRHEAVEAADTGCQLPYEAPCPDHIRKALRGPVRVLYPERELRVVDHVLELDVLGQCVDQLERLEGDEKATARALRYLCDRFG